MVTTNTANARFVDSTDVDVHHEEQFVYWLNRFHVSQLLLRQAVRLVGPKFQDVSAFLSRRRAF